MNLKEALPEVFSRTWPALDPDTQLLLALLLLRSHQLDALPLTIREKEKTSFISGYSIISKLVQTSPLEYGRLFKLSCGDVMLQLPTVPVDSSLESLIRAFSETGFGFAWLESETESSGGGFVRLIDLLQLYNRSIISTDLIIQDIASPEIFSLSGETDLKQALEEMVTRRKRRVLVSGTGRIVSDREIITYLFSEPRLKEIFSNPTTVIQGKLGNVQAVEPAKLQLEQSVKEAAESLVDVGCGICERGLVTPWDVVVKPWQQNRLVIKAH